MLPPLVAGGDKIYFFNETHLVDYDYQAQHTSVVQDFPENQSGSGLSRAFPKDGSTLYAVTRDGRGLMTLWSVDLGSNQAASMVSVDLEDYQTFQFPSPIPDDAYQCLFGSKENPVLEPVIPPGGRFYFYADKKESTFRTDRVIAGYDKAQNLKFQVLTLGTSFHLP